jgi:tRNA U55 pseudouridine synthase TruB
MANALQDLPEYIADKALAEKIMHGNIITKKDFVPEQIGSPQGFIKIVDTNNDLVAVLKHTKESNRYSYCCVFNN